jgi:GntR family transcriptional regulator
VSFPEIEIDRESPVPFYFQLAQALEHEIVAGRWHTGERLPSEAEMCQRLGISRTTVRQALARLEQQGLVSRHKGRGPRARDRREKTWLLQSVEGFFEDEVGRMGMHVSSEILRLDVDRLPGWASEALEVPKDEHGVTLERLRSVEGLVALYVVNHLPVRLAGAISPYDDPNESLYQRLARRAGLEVAGARRVLQAVNAGDKLARLLEVERGAALAYVQSVSWDADMKPFDCYRAWLRTDRLKVDVQVAASIRPAGTTPMRKGGAGLPGWSPDPGPPPPHI